MTLVVYDEETGRLATSELMQLTNALMDAKAKKHPWEVIDLCVKAFKAQHPKNYKSYVIRMKDVRAAQKTTRVGTKYFKGVSKDKNGNYLAHTVDFPAWIMNLIRKVYRTDELTMDKEFFREFVKRHPEFKVMEKV